MFVQKSLVCALRLAIFTGLGLSTVSFAADEQQETNSVQQLETIVVTAEDNDNTEGTNSYAAKRSNTSTKLPLTLRETPQIVKVYTRDYLDDKNIQSFQQLTQNITGVTTSRTDERQSSYARGFQIDYYLVDGLPSTLSLNEGDFDLGIFDRVEVVKGANGLMTGAGNPALGLNFVRKHANSDTLTGKINAAVGSWNSYSSSADLSNALNADGTLRGRVYVKHDQANSFMDFYVKDSNLVYGVLDYDLTDNTSVSLAGLYQQLDRRGIRWGGLPAFYTDGTRTHFPRSLTVSSDWTYWNVDSTALFASLKQKLWADAALNINYSYRQDKKETALLYVSGQVDKATQLSTGDISVYASDATNKENNIDIYVSSPFDWFGRNQEIVLGGSWNQNELSKSLFGSSQPAYKNLAINVSALNFNNMNTQLLTPITTPNKNPTNETIQYAFYLSGKFHVLDPLKIVAGARLSNWKYTSSDNNGNRKFNHQFTPYFGVIYDFMDNHSWYASYTSIFKPQNKRQENGQYLDPSVGNNYETGIKSEWFDGRLNTALAFFQIQQDNYAELTGNKVINSTENAYKGMKGVTSKGIEFELDGEIDEQWHINAGIAHFQAKDANKQKVTTDEARTTANLFIKYDMDKWFAGIGANYRSDIYIGKDASLIKQGGFVLYNALLGYKFSPNIKAQLNVENILDKEYYEGIGNNRMNYGSPRNATLTLQYNF